jgi:hypothetical protein
MLALTVSTLSSLSKRKQKPSQWTVQRVLMGGMPISDVSRRSRKKKSNAVPVL